ncbi:MAG: hypothetical protein Q7S13_01315, partial [Candidatus Omnitrophota bacterium]|nr:hypothetical protein [Candidatus Omnitrophota bacterium]
MRKINFLLLFVIFFSACGDGGGSKKESSEIKDPFAPDISESNLALCKTHEELTGLWRGEGPVKDGELNLTNITAEFGYYGEFALEEWENTREWRNIYKGEYQFVESNKLNLKYRASIYDNYGDGDLIAQQVFEKDAEFSFEGDELILDIAGTVYHLNKMGEEYWEPSFIISRSRYHSDGICAPNDLQPPIVWEKENLCTEPRIGIKWDFLFPEKIDGYFSQSIRFYHSQNRFEWDYIRPFDFSTSDFTMEDKTVDDAISSVDEAVESNNDVRFIQFSGTYQVPDDKTLELTFDGEKISGLHSAGETIMYSVEYSLDGYLKLKDPEGKEYVLADSEGVGPGKFDGTDGVCEGEAIKDVCPADVIVGRWGLASYYQELYGDAPIYFDYDAVIAPFDWLTFYENGQMRIYTDGARVRTFTYQIRKCLNCYSGKDWELMLYDPVD